MADILENPVDLIDDAYEQEIQVEQEMIEVVAYRSYNQLDDKPQINGVELVGNKTSSDLGITDQIESAVNSEAQARVQADNTLQGKIDTEKLARQQADSSLQGSIDAEETARQNADNGLQTQIDAITSKSDVVDVVANYAALQAYDTSSLGNNDVIKVLDDETHEDALTYYRWSTTTQTWTYIGQEAPYYSKGQMDVRLAEKQDKLTAGANIQIQNGTISATDTTYTAGNGLNLNGTEFSADTDILATKEDLEDYYTKPETDNLLAPKLEAELVAALPPTGEEGKLYLTPKAHTSQTATGNPITATVAEDAGAIESFQLDGDTFQQSYTGKNLLNIQDNLKESDYSGLVFSYVNNEITVKGTPTRGWANVTNNISVSLPAGQYTLSLSKQLTHRVYLHIVYTDVTGADEFLINAGETSKTVTLAKDVSAIRLDFAMMTTGVAIDESFSVQLEAGSPATSFEPYVGGTPSPNPDYPQQIQTVTGEQTVSINGTDYPIDLGSIELCKLGTNQDYIYKDGDDWKVHKATAKAVFDENSGFTKNQYGTNAYNVRGVTGITTDTTSVCAMSQYFTGVSYDGRTVNKSNIIFADSNAGMSESSRGITVRNTSWSDLTAFNTWIASNNILCYYTLATPTDTTITDQTLIAQLEAIRTASLENGANTITNTATGSNLAGDMEIGYYGYNPTNRYDKWLWLDINNEYEQIGS